MHPDALVVKSVMASAIRISDIVGSHHEALPGPRGVAACFLGKRLFRYDQLTARSIAQDMDDPESEQENTDHIVAGWGEELRHRAPRSCPEIQDELIDSCLRVVRTTRGLTEDQQKLVRTGSLLFGWTRVAIHFPGREPRLLRAEFETIGRRLYRGNKELYDRTAESLSKFGRVPGARHRVKKIA
jgi:hypothetical protein